MNRREFFGRVGAGVAVVAAAGAGACLPAALGVAPSARDVAALNEFTLNQLGPKKFTQVSRDLELATQKLLGGMP